MKEHQIFNRIVHYLRSGYYALHQDARIETDSFIKDSQSVEGGFTDRSGKNDLYYSVFGLLLVSALEQKEMAENLKSFIRNIDTEKHMDFIDHVSFMVLRKVLIPQEKSGSILTVLKHYLREKNRINPSYLLFLMAMMKDPGWKNSVIQKTAYRFLINSDMKDRNIPCSIAASKLALKSEYNNKYMNEQEDLMLYFDNGNGFRTFKEQKICDILSTAVALFALRESGYDIRIIRPDCLGFINNNYAHGAFLAGTGDKGRDIEYTFYGLLALGTLI